MNLLYNSIVNKHDTGMHPESGKRFERLGILPEIEAEDGFPFLKLVHDKHYIEKVRMASQVGAYLDQDTFTSPGSFEAACHAVGLAIKAAERGDFALVRPPGHHAHAKRASGFCLFNNIAVATQKLVNEGRRVAIFDFDGHFGDGSCDIFYRTNKVLFWSIHQYPAFPGNGFIDEIGKGRGKGFSLNVPLPPGSGDDIFMDAVAHFLPIVKQFQPDVLALSAGFDAHQYDLLLDLKVSTDFYYKLGELLRQNFETVFAVLEGGYNVIEMPKCLNCFLAGFNGQDNPSTEEPTQSGMRVWETYEINVYGALSHLRPFWKDA